MTSKKYSFGSTKIKDSIYDLRSSKNLIGRKESDSIKKEDKGILKFRNV